MAILVVHSKGDLLIHAGFGDDVAAHVAMLPRLLRAPCRTTETVSEQLDASGSDDGRLPSVLVTHSHGDHVNGLNGQRLLDVRQSGMRRRRPEGAGRNPSERARGCRS